MKTAGRSLPSMAELPMLEYRPSAVGPLAGVRVLDLSRLVAGNMLTHVLADFGAEVIKIEDPDGGDGLRNWRIAGIPTYWKVYGRNKKSFALNLRTDAGRILLLRLAASAHVLVENFVPGKLEKLGLAPAVLLAANPNLVIARISAWGQTGPSSGKPGFGTLVEATGGFAAQNGFPDRPPVLPPVALSDMIAGLYGASAVMIALRAVEVGGGTGQVIDLSLLEPMLAAMGPRAADFSVSGMVPKRQGSRVPTTAPRNVYACGDGGYLALSAATQATAARLFQAIGRPELAADPRFADNSARLRHVDELDAAILGFLARHGRDEAVARLEAAGVPAAPVLDTADLVADPHIRARSSLVGLPDPEAGTLPMHNVTPRLSATPGAIRAPAPDLGQHTEEILLELGVETAELARLRENGVVRFVSPCENS